VIGQADNSDSQALPVQVQRRTPESLVREAGINRTLTRGERAVLTVLMDHTLANLPASEKIKRAGVGKGRWYDILKDPWIKQKQIELTQEFVAQHIAPILEASRQTAVTPGRDGWQDRRWLAELGGFYTPRRQVEQHTTGQVAIGIVGIDPKDI
jgi:hypothetical protein